MAILGQQSPTVGHDGLTPVMQEKDENASFLQRKKRMLIMAGCGLAVVAAVGVTTTVATGSDVNTSSGNAVKPSSTTAAPSTASDETSVGSTGVVGTPSNGGFTPVASPETETTNTSFIDYTAINGTDGGANDTQPVNVTLIGPFTADNSTDNANATTPDSPTILPTAENVFAKCAYAGTCAWDNKSADNYCYNLSVDQNCGVKWNDCPYPPGQNGGLSPAPDGRKRYTISGSIDQSGVCVLTVNPTGGGDYYCDAHF
ncbi:hypothetical protein ACHHYP_13443 [Achlya hypogyna]|uniref:Uncharacterized protein n=1 Tax=Achlya hypogyna TaxID=1202772 RepID=A0A1V9YFB2_ACHHY|nr:hypothetical protein ACHHYP_13443 [Achlya hypogyna]